MHDATETLRRVIEDVAERAVRYSREDPRQDPRWYGYEVAHEVLHRMRTIGIKAVTEP